MACHSSVEFESKNIEFTDFLIMARSSGPEAIKQPPKMTLQSITMHNDRYGVIMVDDNVNKIPLVMGNIFDMLVQIFFQWICGDY